MPAARSMGVAGQLLCKPRSSPVAVRRGPNTPTGRSPMRYGPTRSSPMLLRPLRSTSPTTSGTCGSWSPWWPPPTRPTTARRPASARTSRSTACTLAAAPVRGRWTASLGLEKPVHEFAPQAITEAVQGCTSSLLRFNATVAGAAGGKTEDFISAAKLFYRAKRQVKVPTYLVPATQKVRDAGKAMDGFCTTL